MPCGQPTFYLAHSQAMTGQRFLNMLKLGMAILGRQLGCVQASPSWALPSIPEFSEEPWLLLYRDQPLPSADSRSPMSTTSLLLPSGPLHSLCLHSPTAATAPSCWLQIHILALSPLPSWRFPSEMNDVSASIYRDDYHTSTGGRGIPHKNIQSQCVASISDTQPEAQSHFPLANSEFKTSTKLPLHITELPQPCRRNTFRVDFCYSTSQAQSHYLKVNFDTGRYLPRFLHSP